MRSGADFTETTRRGTKVSRGSVVVYARLDGSGPAIVGLVVAKSVGGSVQRHRASRRLRAAIRPAVPSLSEGTRLVVRALPGCDVDEHLVADVTEAVAEAVSRAQQRRSSGGPA
jgi:ribonuclease P protein component